MSKYEEPDVYCFLVLMTGRKIPWYRSSCTVLLKELSRAFYCLPHELVLLKKVCRESIKFQVQLFEKKASKG